MIPGVVKKIIPAVTSVIVSKYLPVFKSFSPSPFELNELFVVPKGHKKIEVGGGSGFIVDPSGIILTNRHVFADPEADYLVITNDGEKHPMKILAKNPINDTAILKIEARNLPTVKLGDSSKLELGETLVAIGNTLGIFRNTVSVGVLSGLSRQISAVNALDNRAQNLRGLIQTDAAINPGNSGGPLVNIKGEVVGINAAMVVGAENVGFALPINAAKKDLEEVKKYGRIRQPFLGIRYVLLNDELREKHKLPLNKGALVISEETPEGRMAVIPESPAAMAGVKESDIILEIEKEKVSFDNPLEDILQKFTIGKTINLKIFRNGKEITAKTVLTERDESV